MGALMALARMAATRGRTFARGRAAAVAAGTGLGALGIPSFGFGGEGDDGTVRTRRRRRKMLTAGDLRDLAAIEGIAGKKAAERALLIRIATA